MKKARSKTAKAGPGDSTVLIRRTNIIERVKSDGTVVIVRLDSFDYFVSLDKIAAKIWTLIDGKSTISQIKNRIIRQYKPPRERFDRDFNNLVKKLRARKLLQE